jgi:hypothetical protein
VKVFHVQCVEAVVAMIPYFKVTQDDGNIITPENEYFLLEKPGLEITQLLDQIGMNNDDVDTVDMGDMIGSIRGNPGVQILNPYPTLHKPLPLVKGKGLPRVHNFQPLPLPSVPYPLTPGGP